MWWYKLANIFFFVFHITLIMFNLFGWMPRRLRRWNLLTLMLTAFSWFVLGIFFGFGYCFLTDWHWQVRQHLGYHTSSHSYIHFLLVTIFPVDISETVVDRLTAILFFAALAISTWVNMRSWKRAYKRRKN